MPNARSNAATLLQKASTQLRGERVPLKTNEEDELQLYLNSIAQKTHQARTVSFEEHGDISISSGADAMQSATPRGRRSASPAAPVPGSVTSKFLKKKKPEDTKAPTSSTQKAAEDNADLEIDDTNKGIVIKGLKTAAGNGPSTRVATTPALNKANALASKIVGRTATGVPLRQHVSGDSESEDSMRGSHVGKRPGSADTSVGRDGNKFLKNRTSVEKESLDDARAPSPQLRPRSSSQERQKRKQKRVSKSKGEIVRTLGNVYLTSEEESLADFIHGLSASEASAKQPQNLVAQKQQKWRKKGPSPAARQAQSPIQLSRSPSPFRRSPSPFGRLSRSQSQDSDLMESMASEIFEEHYGKKDSISSDDKFNVNLMDVASLLPTSTSPALVQSRKSPSKNKGNRQDNNSVFKASSTTIFKGSKKEGKRGSNQSSSKKHKKSPVKRSSSKTSLFETLGIQMVDDLLEVDKGGTDQVNFTDESEIETEKSEDRRKAVLHRNDSESEIITELGGGSRKAPLKRQDSVDDSISEKIGMESSIQQPRPKDLADSESEMRTDTDYSETFEVESESQSITQSYSQRSARKHAKGKRPPSSREISYRSVENRKGKGKEHKVVMEEKRVEIAATDDTGQTHLWNTAQTGISVSGPYGLQYVDPTPVTSHVVSADALEAMTAYSPNVLALQEMMRAQLQLVSNFVDIQKRIYLSCMDGLRADYKYTTLEDTKEYIRQHRKPRLTFKEALQLVEQEDGIMHVP